MDILQTSENVFFFFSPQKLMNKHGIQFCHLDTFKEDFPAVALGR